jgi:hypothetical protein
MPRGRPSLPLRRSKHGRPLGALLRGGLPVEGSLPLEDPLPPLRNPLTARLSALYLGGSGKTGRFRVAIVAGEGRGRGVPRTGVRSTGPLSRLCSHEPGGVVSPRACLRHPLPPQPPPGQSGGPRAQQQKRRRLGDGRDVANRQRDGLAVAQAQGPTCRSPAWRRGWRSSPPRRWRRPTGRPTRSRPARKPRSSLRRNPGRSGRPPHWTHQSEAYRGRNSPGPCWRQNRRPR